MPNLVLCQVSKNLYQPSACAYIFYGNKTAPVDHKGGQIARDGEMPTVLENHLRANVLPALRTHFARSTYDVTGIEYENMEPRPFFVIARRDGRQVSDVDLQYISASVEGALKNMNAKRGNTQGLFSKKEDIENTDDVDSKMRTIKKPKTK